MKKICCIMLALFWMNSAWSQTFIHEYQPNALTGSGVATLSTGNGHLLSATDLSQGMQQALIVVRTDLDGRFLGSPSFQNAYIFDVINSQGNQVPAAIRSSKIIEYADGSGYAVIGSFYCEDADGGGSEWGVYFVQFDPNGGITALKAYLLASPYVNIEVTGIYESVNSPGEVFACGHLTLNGEDRGIFALRVYYNGGLNWGKVYNFNTSVYESVWDLIESPYSRELWLVGEFQIQGLPPAPGGAPMDAYVLRVDPNNGTGPTCISYGLQEACPVYTYETDAFRAITTSSDPAEQAFVICGYTSKCGIAKTWAVKLNLAGIMVWSWVYDDQPGQLHAHGGYDVVGRDNNGNYEYFIAGHHTTQATPTIIGSTIVFWLGNNGQVFTNGIFRYDNPNANHEWAQSIDISYDQWMLPYGFGIYGGGQSPGPIYTPQIINAHFSGYLNCDEQWIEPVNNWDPLYYGEPPVGEVEDFIETCFIEVSNTPTTDDEVCYTPAASPSPRAPSSFRGTQADQQHQISAYPNPAHNQLRIMYSLPGTFGYEFLDISGRSLMSGKAVSGQSIRTESLKPGLYIIRIKGKDGSVQHLKIQID